MVALPIYFWFQWKAGWTDFGRQLRGAWWLIAYLPSIALLSWAGSEKFGGQNYLVWGWDLDVVAAVGLVFYAWGVKSGWRTPSIEAAHGEVPPLSTVPDPL